MKHALPLLLVILCLSACSSAPVTHGIPNLKEVEAGVWRGGQPNAEGWQHLKALGVHQIIKLNTEAEGSDDAALAVGMMITRYPIDLVHQTVLMPDAADVAFAALHIEPGTFVHCSHGEDRTGLVIGVYRVIDGWAPSAAYREMKLNGFHPALLGLSSFWHQNMR